VTRFAVEVTLLWIAVGLYGLSAAFFANAVIFGHPQRVRWARWLALAGLLPHGAAIVLRWVAVGHGPYILKYEVLASNSWIAVAALLLFLWRRPTWGALALVVLPLSILAMGFGLFSNSEVREIPPSLRSIWLIFHITFAKLSAASFLLSLAAAVVILLRSRKTAWKWMERAPPSDVLDAYEVRFIGFGFLFWTITIAAGSIWAHQSWGRYWGWDAIETWSLVSWLAYGSVLHARLFFRLKPTATAWFSVGAFAVFILALLILPFIMPSLHAAYFQ
jgi:cytochrome c-type biogenesis protein CcsB